MLEKKYLTEEELNAPVEVQKIKVSGTYTARGETRKEVIQKNFDGDVIVPVGYNVGQLKLATNKYVRESLKGIRVRTYVVDESAEVQPMKRKMKVRDFMSEKGLRDNERLKKNFIKAQAAPKAPEDFPGLSLDSSEYGADGLPKFSDRLYTA